MMKKLLLLALLWLGTTALAQTNQVVYRNGRVMYGHPIEAIDSMVYDLTGDMHGDTLSLIMPRIIHIYDTVYTQRTDTTIVYDTVQTTEVSTRYMHSCKEGYHIDYDISEAPAEKAFSVSRDVRVVFSPGNLQYQPGTHLWRFAPHQYDYIGEDNKKIWTKKTDPPYEGWLDFFGWGTGQDPTQCGSSIDNYSSFVDWGTNVIGTDSANTWRTLSKEEWAYLLFSRANAGQLVAGATVAGVAGLVLLPDSGRVPSNVTFHSAISQGAQLVLLSDVTNSIYMDSNSNIYNHNTYTAEEWEQLEAAGAIFLPFNVGYRDAIHWMEGDWSGYWATGVATATGSINNEEQGVTVLVNSRYIRLGSYHKSKGFFVRLAKKVKIK